MIRTLLFYRWPPAAGEESALGARAGRDLSRPSAAAAGARRPRAGALARGICRHAPGRHLHLGPVLPEDRPPDHLGRTGRRGADREGACRGCAGGAGLSRRPSCRSKGWLFGKIGLADISIASFFRNADYADFTVDARALAAHRRLRSARALDHSVLRRDTSATRDVPAGAPTPRAAARALLDAGAPLTKGTLGTRDPRKGKMRL